MSEDDHSYLMMRRRQIDGMDYPDGIFADLVTRANLEDYEAEVDDKDEDDLEMEEEDDISVERIGEEDDDSMDESSVESMVEESEEEEDGDGQESV